jgi:hypothetical protein
MQAQKFAGVQDKLAEEVIEKIQRAASPEEAARFGRSFMRERPDLVSPRSTNFIPFFESCACQENGHCLLFRSGQYF